MSISNNQILQESINELNKLKQEIVKLSAQEKAFKALSKTVIDNEKAIKQLEKALINVVSKHVETSNNAVKSMGKTLTDTINSTNDSLNASIANASKGLTQISATAEKRKWRITWFILAVMAVGQITLIISQFNK